MLIDHIGATIIDDHLGIDYPWFYMRHIGRVAFPIFAFLIANGCLHTKDIKKYMLRLGLFALISEVFYDLALGNPINFFYDTNIFYTLFLGVVCIAAFKKIRSIVNHELLTLICAVIIVFPFFAVAEFLFTDYAGAGVVFIYAFFVLNPESRLSRAAVSVAGMVWFYVIDMNFSTLFWFSLIAVPLVMLYNGKPGFSRPWLKWGFYAFYPAHLAIISILVLVA